MNVIKRLKALSAMRRREAFFTAKYANEGVKNVEKSDKKDEKR